MFAIACNHPRWMWWRWQRFVSGTSTSATTSNVIWSPLMTLLPHDHNMWASIGVYTGREDNIIWQRTGKVIEANGATALAAKDVFGLPRDAIHSVINPIGRLTGAIHIYGGNFFAPGRHEWDAETLRERPFDIEAARETLRGRESKQEAEVVHA